jgi:hypothetical protein
MRLPALLTFVLLSGACAHHQPSRSDLDRIGAPAFIARSLQGAGPRSLVFSQDSSYVPRLQKLDVAEADRRFQRRLIKGMGRFEVAERLRAITLSLLPREAPWTDTVDPARVAEIYQTYLLEEEGGKPPDYSRVREIGADSVVEIVIEEYGMRSAGGRAGGYLSGYGRMFTLDGQELWRRSFRVDPLASGQPALDPLAVAKDPTLWRNTMQSMLDAVASQFAKDLTPPGAPSEDRARPPAPVKGDRPAAPPGLTPGDLQGPPGLEKDSDASKDEQS